MRTLHLLISRLAILAACGRPGSAPQVARDQSVQLQVDQTVMVTGTMVRVQFTRAADSRCPLDAVCITAGEAVIEVLFSGNGAIQTATLRLGQKHVTAIYGGLLFEATALDPFPNREPSLTQTLTLRVTALSS